jgi:hypothetical protein
MVLAAAANVLEPPDRFLLDSFGSVGDAAVAIVTVENGCAPVPAVREVTLVVRVPLTSKPVRFVERVRQGPGCSDPDY